MNTIGRFLVLPSLMLSVVLSGATKNEGAVIMNVSNQLPGGNIRVISQNGNDIVLEQEQRDSPNQWFYWKFKAEFPERGIWHFRFTSPNKVGTRGPCISSDQGKTWRWMSESLYADTQGFSYAASGKEEIWFCQAFPYMRKDLDLFIEKHRNDPAFSVSELTKSRKGRSVPLITIKKGNPADAVLLTARHHCQESMASYVLEGFLEAALKSDILNECAVYSMPVADTDGVEDGDQGKGRSPRDHGRDYEGESLWPECAAIRKFAAEIKPFVIFDLHCPWIRYHFNEDPYFVEGPSAPNRMEIARMAGFLEDEAPAEAPFRKCRTMRWGVDWNTSANGRNCTMPGIGISKWGTLQEYNRFSATLEIPFANFGTHTISDTEARAFGAALFRAFRRYRKAVLEEEKEQIHTAKISFTGDVMCCREQLAACRKADGKHDFSGILDGVADELKKGDYLVGNLETPFAGKEAGFSNQLYSFNTPDEFAFMLAEKGFDLVSTANNHVLDRGVEGLKRTLDILDSSGIAHTGTARTEDERNSVFMRNIRGIRTAFISYTYGTNAFANNCFLKNEERHLVNLLQPQETLSGSIHLLNPPEVIAAETAKLPEEDSAEMKQLAGDIRKAKENGADFVIILLHCGGQHNPEPEAYTEYVVRKLKSCGADLVIGNHPHRIQKYEILDGMPVFYCLGNFAMTPGESPECVKDPVCTVSAILRIGLKKEKNKCKVEKASFFLAKSVLLPDGKAVVRKMTDLIREEKDEAKKKELLEEARSCIRVLTNKDVSGNPEEEYFLF